MNAKKITTGFVIQTWDTDKKKWINQEFIAGDDTTWEDEHGNILEDPPTQNNGLIPYLNFDMIQPE